MRIFLASPIDPDAERLLAQSHEVTPIAVASDVVGDPGLATCEILIVRSGVTISEDALGGAPKLRLVVRAGSGLDNIAMAYLRDRGIALVRIPGVSARAVAELTFALILALERRIVEADRGVRQGQWRKHELAGRLLEERVLGIVGAGHIGSAVGRLGVAWGMRVIGCIDEHDDVSRARLAGTGLELETLDTVIRTADILTIHVPLTSATRHLVGGEQLARMKPGSVVVNSARGGVLDEDALHDALVSGRLAGAGLDVHEREGEGVIPRLAALPNVVLTPHIGAMAIDAQRRIGTRVIELIEAFERGDLSSVAHADEIVA